MWLIEDGPDLERPELVGRKFATQAALARDGFRVPPLICIPATVFDQVVGALLPAIAAPHDTSEATLAVRAQELRRRVRDVAFPAQLSAALADRFGRIAGQCGLVAVRACVVPCSPDGDHGEDSAEDPYAGLSDSYLYVGRAAVAAKVAGCWSNAEAAVYRILLILTAPK
jgi:pyruvate,water dikinase